MNPRFFPRYNVKNYEFELFFLGTNPSVLPDILNVDDLSLSGARIRVANWRPEFHGAKLCLKYNSHTLYFQSRVVWTEILNNKECMMGLKLLIPTAETFQKWLAVIETIDQNLRGSLVKTKKDSVEHRASSY